MILGSGIGGRGLIEQPVDIAYNEIPFSSFTPNADGKLIFGV